MTSNIIKRPLGVDLSYFKKYENFKITPYSIENIRGIYTGTKIEEMEILWIKPAGFTLFYQIAFREIAPRISKWQKIPINHIIKDIIKYAYAFPYTTKTWKPISEKEHFAILLQNNEIREFSRLISRPQEK